MDRLNFGDIVLLQFPFTDGITSKRRPALIINDFNDGDIVVCRVTSQIYTTKNDLLIKDWQEVGLKSASVIRVHKIATLDKNMVEVIIGRVDKTIKSEIKTLFSKLTE